MNGNLVWNGWSQWESRFIFYNSILFILELKLAICLIYRICGGECSIEGITALSKLSKVVLLCIIIRNCMHDK